jgi:hypothetical protein
LAVDRTLQKVLQCWRWPWQKIAQNNWFLKTIPLGYFTLCIWFWSHFICIIKLLNRISTQGKWNTCQTNEAS